jgi:tetratricopeptide (TPR) repeat protein/tRNA A-37 threonylcarbamoyl transferase component Bud32
MTASPSNSFCTKCGQPIPAGAGFCPSCGSPVAATPAAGTIAPIPVTMLPTGITAQAGAAGPTDVTSVTPAITGATVATPPRAIADAPTMGPTGIVTSLDSPSPRVPIRGSDGPFQAGQQVGPRYTILKLLGTGGMGAVYQAFDHELGVAVAIKVIRPSAQSDATAAKELETRFKRELVLARQVTHKYVVRIHDLGEIDGIKYLTMPFVEGETLAQVLRKTNTLPIAQVIRIAQQVSQGLAAAHEKGVIHRDLKPENIMLEKPAEDPVPNSGDALIMDFGIARSVEQGATQTAAGSVIGTLEYMAPEQAQGKKVDGRADQYAFGLIMYDMLVGRQRLADRENAMAELLARMQAAPKAPRAIDPAIPESVNEIVVKLLDPDPNRRYESTKELVAALDRLEVDGSIRSDIHEVIIHDAPARSKLAMAAVFIILIGGVAGWMLSGGGVSQQVEAARDPITVLIGDFENKTGDPLFDGVVEQALTLGIEGASYVTTFPRRDALRAATAVKPGAKLDEQTARLVALRENVGMVIVGSIEPKGAGYHISIRGLGPGAAGEGEVKYTLEDDAASKADVLTTVGALAGNVRKALGDTTVPANGAATEAFTAANLEAASAYAAAQEFAAAGRRDDAIAKYQEALKFDPEFGRAYSGLAAQYEAVRRPVEAEANYQQALARIDRMSDREKYRTRGLYNMFARKNEQAVQEFISLLKAYPYDSTGLTNLALSNFYLRNFGEAMEHGRKAVVIQPKNIIRRYNVALYAMYAGQFETAIVESNAALEINATTLKAFVARGLSELALGKNADATKTYQALAATSADGASFAAAGLADIAIVEGRLTDAIAILTKGAADDLARKSGALAAAKFVAAGEAKLLRGDAAGATKDAQAAVAAAPIDGVRASAGLLLARAGRRAEAEALAAELEKRLEPDPQSYGKLIRAEVALSANQARAAVDLAREAGKLADTWLGHVILGRAYLALDAFPDAHTEFDTAMKRQGEATAVMLDDVPSYRFLPPVHYYLGRAQEGIKSAGALQSYKTFLAFVKSEESAAPGGLVADARARLAKLGS